MAEESARMIQSGSCHTFYTDNFILLLLYKENLRGLQKEFSMECERSVSKMKRKQIIESVIEIFVIYKFLAQLNPS